MLQYPNYPSPNAQVLDLQTAVKDGLLGPSPAAATESTLAPSDLRAMIDQLDVMDDPPEVPSVFICPISLEPMADPVTLCTGQTYDRPNIARWLAMGHLSCPTTMQELWDPSLTPNATLRHLLLAWFSHRSAASSSHARALRLLQALHTAKGHHAKARALADIRRLREASPGAAAALVAAGAVPALSALLGPLTSHAVGSEALALLVGLLPCEPLAADAGAALAHPAKLSLVADMLHEGTPETRLHCVAFLEVANAAMAAAEEDGGEGVASSPSLLVGLLRMARDRRSPGGVAPSLRLLRQLCSRRRARAALVGVGAVTHVVDLLPELPGVALEPAVEMLARFAGDEEGRAALRGCPAAIPNVVRVLMRASEACTGHALEVLRAVVRDGAHEEAAVEAGLGARLLLVMQSACGAAVKQRAAEMLKLCSRNYSDSRFISKCKLTRTMQ